MSVNTAGSFQLLFDNNYREIQQEGLNAYLSGMKEKFYKVQGSDSAYEQFGTIGSVPDVVPFNGAIRYLSITPGYTSKIEHAEYAGGVMFERKLLDDKKFTDLEDGAKGLGASVAQVVDKLAHGPFNDAFSAAFAFMQSEEGIALCGTHTTKSGVSTSSGFDNAGTSSLNKTSIIQSVITMSRFRDLQGNRMNFGDPVLVVPRALAQEAYEATGTNPRTGETSALDPSSANHKVNYARGIRVEVLDRLDDTSTSNWFTVDWKMMKDNLLWFDRVSPEFKNTVDFDTMVAKMSTYFRCSYGWKKWQWINGQNVS